MDSFNKKRGEFFPPKTLSDRLVGLNTMKKLLGVDKALRALQRSFKAATKLRAGLPTNLEMESIPMKDRSSLAKEIYVKTQEASQNTDLNMQRFLRIDKALQSIQTELLNNTLKLTEIDKLIKRDTKKPEEVENDPTYTDEQMQLFKDRLDN